MTETEALMNIEEIKKVFARRLRYMDLKQWELYGPASQDLQGVLVL